MGGGGVCVCGEWWRAANLALVVAEDGGNSSTALFRMTNDTFEVLGHIPCVPFRAEI